MIGKNISHYKIIDKLGEPACRAGAEWFNSFFGGEL